MNWKMALASNWKLILLLVQLGILMITLTTGHVLADPIDDPWGPK